jgi:capsular polysaccharide transport system ATP-binding protein
VITLRHVSKRYRGQDGASKEVLRNVSMAFPPGRNVGIVGANGAGKSTLLRLLAGSELPDEGEVERHGRVSFPLGFNATWHPDLSGRENVSFLARVYGAPVARVLDFVADFAELGHYLDMPVATYSAGMSAKLAFGVSLAIDFDVYLVDEITEVGDARFRAKSAAAFQARLAHSSLILVSHNTHTIRKFCDCCAILEGGRLHPFDTVDEAMQCYLELMGTTDA